MTCPTLVSWSSGKDSAWMLHTLRQDPAIELAGLCCTVNREFERVAMHGVRVALLQQQAEQVGLPLDIIELPWPCSNADYERIMDDYVMQKQADGIEQLAFGDLFLEDVRDYRVRLLADSTISPLFPLWGQPTARLARDMIAGGLEAVITCVDPEQVPGDLAGCRYDDALLARLPSGADPCGENGEFHSVVVGGPMFSAPIEVTVGEVVERDGFVFADVVPVKEALNN